MTIKDVSQHAGCCSNTIAHWIRLGLLPVPSERSKFGVKGKWTAHWNEAESPLVKKRAAELVVQHRRLPWAEWLAIQPSE